MELDHFQDLIDSELMMPMFFLLALLPTQVESVGQVASPGGRPVSEILAFGAEHAVESEVSLGRSYVFFKADGERGLLAWGVPTVQRGGLPVVCVEAGGLRFVRSVADVRDASSGVAMRWTGELSLDEVTGQADVVFPSHRLVGPEAHFESHDIEGFEQLVVADVWSGVDLVLASDRGGLRYDLHVDPGVDPSVIEFVTETPFELVESGRLVFADECGVLEQTAPYSFLRETNRPVGTARRAHSARLAESDSEELASSFRRKSETSFGFEVQVPVAAQACADCDLVIDPGVYWSSFIDGNLADWVLDMAFMDDERFVFAGRTETKNGFPVTTGVFPWSDGGSGVEGFVVGVHVPTGLPLFSLLVGGNGYDSVIELEIDPTTKDLILVLATDSTDLPVDAASEPWVIGAAPVMRLDMSTPAVVYSKLISGPANSTGIVDLVVGSGGDLFVTGLAYTQTAPYHATAGSLSEVPLVAIPESPGSTNVITPYASRIDGLTGRVKWRTFVDGPVEFLAISEAGELVFGGKAWVNNHATSLGAVQVSPQAASLDLSAFLQKLSSDGKKVEAATYFDTRAGVYLQGVGVRSGGEVFLAGNAITGAFPATPGAFSTTFEGARKGFVLRMSANLTAIERATLFGDPGHPTGGGFFTFDVDGSGVVTLGGAFPTPQLPLTPGSKLPSEYDGLFLSRLTPDLDKLLFSAMFGWKGGATPPNVSCLGPSGQAMVGGVSLGGNLETVPSSSFPNPKPGLELSGFVVGLDMLPIGVWSYGKSTNPCGGSTALGVDRAPIAGDANFSMYAMEAIPNAVSVLVVSAHADPLGMPAIGVTSFIDLSQPLVWQVVTGPDASGFQMFSLPIPAQLAGKELFAQVVYLDLGACGPAGTWGASNALRLQIQ